MNVLLIEDDSEFAEDLRLLLPPEIDLIWASNSQAALDVIGQPRSIDAVILDLCLPSHLAENEQVEGLELLSVLKRKLAVEAPVFVLSALPKADFEAACLSRDAAAYLQKPCSIRDLIGHLARVGSDEGI